MKLLKTKRLIFLEEAANTPPADELFFNPEDSDQPAKGPRPDGPDVSF